MADAWDLTGRAAAAAGVRIAPLEALSDAEAVAAVIARVWGEQPLGSELLRALEHAGCPFLGAWEADVATKPAADRSLVGYVLGFVGVAGGLHVHSHMLAVMPEWRRRGAGFALKLAQRAWALDAGIPEIRWTFDPLLLGNARFNLLKLGGVATAFLPNFYGAMQDELNRGERTDRFELTWMTSAERVHDVLEAGGSRPGRAPPDAVPILTWEGDPDAPRPVATGMAPGERALVAIPPHHLQLRRSHPPLAAAWREAAGTAFRACFDHGLAAASVTDDGRYVFERSST